MKRIYLWAGLIGCMLLAACRASQFEKLPPNEIISRSADRMASLAGFEFLIERSGEPAYLDVEQTISFRRAEGKFTSPDRVYTSVRVITPGLVTEVQIISLGGTQWETNLLTGEWQASDPRYSFNPSLLFNPETGISAILPRELTDPRALEMEELPEVPGKKLYVIESVLKSDSAYRMTFGMIDNEPLHVKLWIDPVSFNLYRIVLVDPANSGDQQDTTWQI
ncbi:MAG TPA: LppX_LprAFG lipoprotein, partial [Anaerolineales bacterium]|nr:LppX_LprAFG lipoprotein [Anaerolineales bacterium]